MSISSQITRINNAKAAIKTAIAAKGVTVPDSAMLDDYAALIGNISGGGGETGVVASGECGEYVTWELYNTGELIISGAGAMENYTGSGLATYAGYEIKRVVIENGVTTVGNMAFAYQDSLVSVTIPESVVSIGKNAFIFCHSLSSITIGKNVTTIELAAFSNCINLLSVTISKSVVSIGNSVFGHCDNLTNVYYEGTKAEWDSIVIEGGNEALTNATLHCEYVYEESGGTGGGIIEVPELPTENIVENAVYKVVTSTEPIPYVYNNGNCETFESFLQKNGASEIYFYYPEKIFSYDMLYTDVNDLSTNPVHCYFDSEGDPLIRIQGYGTIDLASLFGLSAKGFTDDVTTVSENGVYVQRAKSTEEFYVRDSGEWKIISADMQEKTVSLTNATQKIILPDEGKALSAVTVRIGFLTIADFINNSGECEITEECFLKPDGNYTTNVRAYAFAGSKITSAVIPDGITALYNSAFAYSSVQEVTFKGKPRYIDNSAFSNATQLTKINVSWGYNEVEGAPWGATNATINYNYTGE